ncbi:MAG: hypothetical protein ACERKN_19120 [Velocimicrobium sp.]
MNAQEIKKRLYELDADLFGIASVDRFDEAPEGTIHWMCFRLVNRL